MISNILSTLVQSDIKLSWPIQVCLAEAKLSNDNWKYKRQLKIVYMSENFYKL